MRNGGNRSPDALRAPVHDGWTGLKMAQCVSMNAEKPAAGAMRFCPPLPVNASAMRCARVLLLLLLGAGCKKPPEVPATPAESATEQPFSTPSPPLDRWRPPPDIIAPPPATP